MTLIQNIQNIAHSAANLARNHSTITKTVGVGLYFIGMGSACYAALNGLITSLSRLEKHRKNRRNTALKATALAVVSFAAALGTFVVLNTQRTAAKIQTVVNKAINNAPTFAQPKKHGPWA